MTFNKPDHISLINSACLAYFNNLSFPSQLLNKKDILYSAVENLNTIAANIISIYSSNYPELVPAAITKSTLLLLSLLEDLLSSDNNDECIIRYLPDLTNKLYIATCQKITDYNVDGNWSYVTSDLLVYWNQLKKEFYKEQPFIFFSNKKTNSLNPKTNLYFTDYLNNDNNSLIPDIINNMNLKTSPSLEKIMTQNRSV